MTPELPVPGVPALKDHTDEHVATIRTITTPDRIGEALGRIFPSVWGELVQQGLKPTGAPFARYHRFDETVDLEGGVAVESAGVDSDLVRFSSLPAGRVATIWHAGSYDTLKDSWTTLEAWIRNQGLTPSEPCWEVYWTDPREVTDPNDWRTEILWRVE